MFGVISTPGKLKNMSDYGRNRTHDLWNASAIRCQLSGNTRSGRFEYVIFCN